MTPNDDQNQGSIQDSVAKLLDGEISEEEFEVLAIRLREDSNARKEYVECVSLEISLDSILAPPLSRTTARRSVSPAAIRRRVWRSLAVTAAAAVIILSALSVIQTKSEPYQTQLRLCKNSQWQLDGTRNRVVSTLPVGAKFVLEQGVAELKLPNEVLVVVEAPAALSLTDEQTLRLDYGRAFCHVSSEEGKGFTVVTPHQRIVDLGTAFGVDSRNGRNGVELHVFKGRVRVDDLNGGVGEVITANRSVLLAGTRVQRDLDKPSTAFLRQLPPMVETVFREDFESGLVAGRNYAVQMDRTAIRDFSRNRFSGIEDNKTWNFSTEMSATVPIPVASYEYGSDPESRPQATDFQEGTISDVGNVKLTDGQLATEGWSDGSNVGFRNDLDNGNPQPQVTFDFGAAHNVVTVDLWTVSEFLSGEESVSISSSADGVRFSMPIVVNPLMWTGGFANTYLRRGSVDVSSLPGGQFFRVEVFDSGQWAMINEVQFRKDVAMPSGRRFEGDVVLDSASVPVPSLSDRDDSPPVIIGLHPADDATDAVAGGQLTMIFDEAIKLGTGRIFLRNISDWSEREIAVGGPRTTVEGRILRINPPADLQDGDRSRGWISGWEGDSLIGLFNPSGDGTGYVSEGMQDHGRTRGTIGAMRGPIMANFGAGRAGAGIRRAFGSIAPDRHYTISAAIGVRAAEAKEQAVFLGYTIRLRSGAVVLAELVGDTPPGPPNSVSPVSFSWDSATLPEGVAPGDPLVIEIAPNLASGLEPGYLDIDNVQVTVVGE